MQTNVNHIFRRRLTQLVVIAEVPLLLLGIKAIYEPAYIDAWILLVGAVLLLVVPWFTYQQRHKLASGCFIGILSLMMVAMQWSTGGIRDNSVMALPGLLIFASMIGFNSLYNSLLVFLICNLLLMGIAADSGWVFDPSSNSFSNAFNISIILVITAIAAKILARDNINLVALLNQQVEEVRRAKEDVEFRALHDNLTNLPNRQFAEEHFDVLQHRLSRGMIANAAVIYVDFDEFKDINDTQGHAVGDRFLTAKAQALVDCTRVTDQVCRIGGDEFLILVEDLEELQLAQLAQKLLQHAMREIQIDGNLLHCTCSIGIVCLPKDAETYEDAVKRADIAMYRSKRDGKNRFHFYDRSMELIVNRRYQLQSQIMSAILDEQFYIVLQPIVHLESRNIVGAEVLARWAHPELGEISPAEFIPLAESNGLIDELWIFVMHHALEAARLLRQLEPEFYVTVNIAPNQLKSPGFFDQCEHVIRESQLPFSALKLEITESEMIERDTEFDATLDQLHQNNIGLLLDDFGTGYSNLGHLQKMLFEAIKVDRLFINHCHLNEDTGALLRAIVAMSGELNVGLIAEGIETEDELARVQELGILKGQGYLLARPMLVNDLKQALQTAA
ncbi:putative bifunctional diguanylate cyclase/phosphodiesterase [Reinekea blandensis]|uniref:Inner membrane protein PLUS sensory box protein LssE n=1 Tax=Reinekea blandensis MED297 TaxID=314283 RepID=A4BB62_9GAMM|nr:EAL domain-containing protein [Reinekea blandensis]EAR10675.1 inner membrane protein PLUS sensory box protein LssE [Reinekea sp. MED297] [Reinekea blandensis MED297]